jgi:hypothetical protein
MALETDTTDENLQGGLTLGSAPPEEEEDAGALPYAAVRTAMTARKEAAKARQKYYDDLTAKLAARQAGPSFSERMYELSSAFFAPTTTRGFSGVAGNVLPVLASQQKAQREGEIKREDALSALAAAQLAQSEGLAEQAVDTEVELAKLANKRRPIGFNPVTGVKEYMDEITPAPVGAAPERPKTEIRGGVMGTYDQKGEWKPLPQRPTQETFRPATPEEAAARNAVSGQVSNLTGLFKPDPAPKPRELTGYEQKLLVKTEDVLNGSDDTIRKLQRIIELNPQALEGSLTGFRKQVGSLFSSDDPTYVATEELDNLKSQIALGSLKDTFPGAISNDERKALEALQGSSDKPRPVRERIYRNALAAAQRIRARAEARTLKIQEGYYTRRAEPKPASTGTPRLINWN